MRITRTHLDVVAANEVGLQKQGYWYVTYADVEDQARHLAAQVLSVMSPLYRDLVLHIYNSILAEPCRAAWNTPYFIDRLIADAERREEEAISAWIDYEMGRDESLSA